MDWSVPSASIEGRYDHRSSKPDERMLAFGELLEVVKTLMSFTPLVVLTLAMFDVALTSDYLALEVGGGELYSNTCNYKFSSVVIEKSNGTEAVDDGRCCTNNCDL